MPGSQVSHTAGASARSLLSLPRAPRSHVLRQQCPRRENCLPEWLWAVRETNREAEPPGCGAHLSPQRGLTAQLLRAPEWVAGFTRFLVFLVGGTNPGTHLPLFRSCGPDRKHFQRDDQLWLRRARQETRTERRVLSRGRLFLVPEWRLLLLLVMHPPQCIMHPPPPAPRRLKGEMITTWNIDVADGGRTGFRSAGLRCQMKTF